MFSAVCVTEVCCVRRRRVGSHVPRFSCTSDSRGPSESLLGTGPGRPRTSADATADPREEVGLSAGASQKTSVQREPGRTSLRHQRGRGLGVSVDVTRRAVRSVVSVQDPKSTPVETPWQ